METKLKALKVADLKEILTTVSIPTTARATKADLISKLLASDAAQAEYQRKYEPDAAPKPVPAVISKDSLLEPPLDDEHVLIAWSDPEDEPVKAVPAAVPTVVAPPSAKPPSAVKLTSTPLAETAPVLEPSAPADLDAAVNEPEAAKLSARAERFGLPDEVEMRKARAERFGVPVSNDANVPATPLTEEQERALAERKARAERFGIPLIDPQTVTPDQSRGRGRRSRPKQLVDSLGATTEVPEKTSARAQRPATGAGKPQSTSAAKRKAAQESVDPEEAERRRKRAERFGTGAKP